MPATHGRFITLEGIEGCGKSTQARLLAAGLAEAGFDTVLTREPGGSSGAEAIRKVIVGTDLPFSPMTEALLHCAARRDHLDHTIVPALTAGRWVVCDRYADSTRAYQSFGSGLAEAFVERLHALVAAEPRPDLTLILDLETGSGLARARSRSSTTDRYERRDEAFHQRVRDGFLEIAASDPERCAVIDADGSEALVTGRIAAVAAERLGVILPGLSRP